MLSFRVTRPTALLLSRSVIRSHSAQTSASLEKLRSALEEYRQVHYSQCLPTRFKKDLVKAAAEEGRVLPSGIQRVLANIGAEQSVSTEEIQTIFQELGNESGEIPTQRMIQLL